QTQVILLDEPTTYLDLGHQLEILNLLKELNIKKGITIIMVLHDLNLAARFSDYMIAMKSGAVIYQGKPND
ncbi:ABC transporter ATP-binding protein, partial [Bacillus cereus]